MSSVKPSPPGGIQVSVGLRIDGAQVHIARLSLKDYVSMAYRLKIYQVTGPDWIASERFDIDAKLPPGGAREQVPEMLQGLLAERFQVKMHHESKEFAVYALGVASGTPKLKESPEDAAGDAASANSAVEVAAGGGPGGVGVNFGKGSSFSFGNSKLEVKKLTMPQFVDTLARFMDRPVVDMTSLTGKYDFSLDVTPEDYRTMLMQSALTAGVNLPPEALRLMGEGGNESLIASLRSLGLKLERRRAPLDIVVVDSALKTPTEN